MKGMPLPLDFEGKGVSSELLKNPSFIHNFDSNNNNKQQQGCFVLGSGSSTEPTSVLDTYRSPSSPTSTSTLSSSFGGGGGAGGSGGCFSTDVAAISGNPSPKWQETHRETTTSSNVGLESGCSAGNGGGGGSLEFHHPFPLSLGGGETCGLGMEDWESVLSDSVEGSTSQEQSMLGWIMGDVDDPSMDLNKMLQIGSGAGPFAVLDFNGGVLGVSDQGGFSVEPLDQVVSCGGATNLMGTINPSLPPSTLSNFKLPNPQNPLLFSPRQQSAYECSDLKPQIFNPQVLINQHQVQHTQNPGFFLPLSQAHPEQHFLMPPNPKRHNPGSLEPNCPIPKPPFSDSGSELFLGKQQQQGLVPYQLQVIPHHLQPRPALGSKTNMVGDEMGQCFLQKQEQQLQLQQQGIIDQLYKAAELVQTGNPILAQQILARLNQQLSPIGKPLQRAAFYFKEALQLLLHTNNNMNPSVASPFSLIFKIGAYKSFSEISPLIQFANFSCNQALLEVSEAFDRIHIVDFDIGYGGQWASLMQELALRNGGAPSLKLTAFASPSTHDQLELSLTRENLIHFANEINMVFEFEIANIDSLSSGSWSLPLRVSENEAIAVNLPVGSFSNYQLPLPLVLRFVKQLSPRIVVSVDRGCDRTDLPFPNHVIQALQSHTNLLESLDAANVNLDVLQKIERFLLQPGVEKIVMGRFHSPEKTQHWRTMFLSSGFSPLTFSNFTESQAECVLKRTPVRGFHVEKRQSSLVLCWQRKELISASAWRC